MPVPHNNYVTKPRALNRFIDGLAELGASKAFIKNKKFLRSDLIEKEKGHQNGENTSENEGHVKSSSDREVEGEEIALLMAVKPKTIKRVTTILKTTVRKQKVKTPHFILKIPANIVRLLICTGH